MKAVDCNQSHRTGVTNLFETESYFLVQIHAKGYQVPV